MSETNVNCRTAETETQEDYGRVRSRVYALKEAYGNQIKAFSVGRSVLGRGIYALGLGEIRGATLMIGGAGGRDFVSCGLLFRFFEELMLRMKEGGRLGGIEVQKAMRGRSVVVIPCLNPDGFELALHGRDGAGQMGDVTDRMSEGDYAGWEANARGVDLRLNFDAGWEASGAARASGYAGPRAMSEPEARAAANLCTAFDLKQLFVFGAGPVQIGYRSGDTPVRSRLMAQVLAGACGMKVSETPSAGGVKDWFIQEMNRPAFSIGLDSSETVEEAYSRLIEMMVLAMLI